MDRKEIICCRGCNQIIHSTQNEFPHIYHRECFRCSICNVLLTCQTAKSFELKLYCCEDYPPDKLGVNMVAKVLPDETGWPLL